GDTRYVLVYLQLKPKLENNKYVENESAFPGPPKGKHTMENVLAPKPTATIQVDDEEEEHEDSGGLGHRGRRKPPNKKEVEHVTTPPQPQEGDDEHLDVVQGESCFKR
ncbi:hypothetical protein KI387_019811, partial [Taxus chinensis]